MAVVVASLRLRQRRFWRWQIRLGLAFIALGARIAGRAATVNVDVNGKRVSSYRPRFSLNVETQRTPS